MIAFTGEERKPVVTFDHIKEAVSSEKERRKKL